MSVFFIMHINNIIDMKMFEFLNIKFFTIRAIDMNSAAKTRIKTTNGGFLTTGMNSRFLSLKSSPQTRIMMKVQIPLW